MSKKRTDGLGTITPMPDGRFRARGPRQPDGSRPPFGIHPTHEAAERALQIGIVQLRESKRVVGQTFLIVGRSVIEEREKVLGIRDARNERSRFENHLATALFANMLMDGSITPVHIATWLRQMLVKKAKDRRGERLLDRETIARALSLLSSIFDAAGPQGRGLVPSNPCLGMKVLKRAGKEATREKSTWLKLPEQEWFSVPRVTSNGHVYEHERLAILFSLSGIRLGEQMNLELEDLHEEDPERPHAVIRFGSKGGPRKNDNIYEADLFGYALMAAREWRKRLPLFCPHNFDSLVWPTESGCRRAKPLGNGHFRLAEENQRGTHVIVSGKPKRAAKGGTHVYVDRLDEVMRIAGITRNVRWHDMRHTTGTSLVSGEWGEPWSLEEVRAQLDHSSITVTQRYAKMSKDARSRAAKKVTLVGQPLATSTENPPSPETDSL